MADDNWLPIRRAAPLLGLTEQGLRKRIAAGTVRSREEVRGNKKRVLVLVEHPVAVEDANRTNTDALRVAQLEVKVALLEQQLVALQGARDRLNQLLDAERERVDRLLAALAERPRRPWPGLRAWWRRFVHGEE